jgi:TROVE domain-containing protein
MSKFESTLRNRGLTSAITTLDGSDLSTYNGAPGFERDAQSELLLLASQFMVNEKTYYENDVDRRNRFNMLIWICAVEAEDWTVDFLRWLRCDANIRSASIAGACEFVHGRWFVNDELAMRSKPLRKFNASLGRQVADLVCQRGDEPAELLAYWVSSYGKPIPAAIRRGAGDAATRLYTEFNAGKYDGNRRAFRMGDLLQLSRPRPTSPAQSGLFKGLIADRLGIIEDTHPDLTMRRTRQALMNIPVDSRRAWLTVRSPELVESDLKAAGFVWEDVAGWLQGPMDKAAWEACIPIMGVFALLRNLRNFDEAGVSDVAAQKVCDKISETEAVRRARVFPMRFLSAYRAAPSLRWSWALERGMAASLSLLPTLRGRTLLLIDSSDSMYESISEESELMFSDNAKAFGLALAKRILESGRGDAVDVVSFSSAPGWGPKMGAPPSKVFTLRLGESVLAALARWENEGLDLRWGTDTIGAVNRHYSAHDRVIVLTDAQADDHSAAHVFAAIPDRVPCYTYNLVGYRVSHAPSGVKNRHELSGLSDSSFQIMSALEAHGSGRWPWEHVS